MTKTAPNRIDKRSLADKLGISIVTAEEGLAARPEIVNDIKRVTKIKYESYGGLTDGSARLRAQRNATRNQVIRIVSLAKRCEQLNSNEGEWRTALETKVFRQFSMEVDCLKCHGRLWRSEIEASYPISTNCFAKLKERRGNRTECYCGLKEDCTENYELDRMFHLGIGRTIKHVYNSEKDPVKMERPDLTLGFVETRRFREALNKLPAESENEVQYRSFVKSASYPIIFPFLVCEAKSEQSTDGFRDIEFQTMFTIYTLLKIQEGLQNESAKHGISPLTCPMVWFFAYRGANWRIYICYTEKDKKGNSRYEISNQWSGCLKFNDDALTLLLLVDYIFDWARDVHRTSILSQLKILSEDSFTLSRTATQDSDILSDCDVTDDSDTDHQMSSLSISRLTSSNYFPSATPITPDCSESGNHDKDHTEILQSQSGTLLAPFKPNSARGIVRHESGRISKHIKKHKSVNVKSTAGTPRGTSTKNAIQSYANGETTHNLRSRKSKLVNGETLVGSPRILYESRQDTSHAARGLPGCGGTEIQGKDRAGSALPSVHVH
ncbi:uncharacterized protein K441DRAFT_660617 [Cenococcum geophilum 1.58]|uniref:uncharacterized protein n=1 Tax=Cenococcum geophilum 1.58 TaxID=794803 RepID=UPI00358EED3E|nr:hypothetical protein K441DRAFT_660617 [Cenococcum geophilum 1.58]